MYIYLLSEYRSTRGLRPYPTLMSTYTYITKTIICIWYLPTDHTHRRTETTTQGDLRGGCSARADSSSTSDVFGFKPCMDSASSHAILQAS